MEWFKDSYQVKWELQDETGKKWIETHREMSLSDFEVLYGNNVHHIIWVEMRLEGEIRRHKK